VENNCVARSNGRMDRRLATQGEPRAHIFRIPLRGDDGGWDNRTMHAAQAQGSSR